MTIDELAKLISRGFAALANGQDAIAAELRATRVHIARIKGQREIDQEAHDEDINAIGSAVQEVERKLRLVTPKSFPAVIPPEARKGPAE